MKPRHIVMGVALVLAAMLVFFGDATPDMEVAEPVERATPVQAPMAAPAAARASAALREDGPTVQRLIPRDLLIGGDDRFNAGENAVFARRDWTPPPPPPPEPPPPPPPSAPPLPFTFIGKSLQDGQWQIYLARGQRVYLVRENEVIDGTYRVEAIKPPFLTLTYLPLDKAQQLNIGVFD